MSHSQCKLLNWSGAKISAPNIVHLNFTVQQMEHNLSIS